MNLPRGNRSFGDWRTAKAGRQMRDRKLFFDHEETGGSKGLVGHDVMGERRMLLVSRAFTRRKGQLETSLPFLLPPS